MEVYVEFDCLGFGEVPVGEFCLFFLLTDFFEQGVDQSKILSSSLVDKVPEGGPVFDSIEFWLSIVIGGTNGFCLSLFLCNGDLLFIAVVISGTN